MVQKSITIYLEGRKIGEWMLQDNLLDQQVGSKIVLLSQRIPHILLEIRI